MFSNSTARAKVQEPAVSGSSRALINTPLFSVETSLSSVLLSCLVGWRQEEKQEVMPSWLCLYPALLSWMDKNTEDPPCPLQAAVPSESSARKMYKSNQMWKIPTKGFHLIRRSDRADLRPHPTPLLLFDFHHECYTVPVHSQAFAVGLFGHILAFERCQSAKTEVAIANHSFILCRT